MFYVLYNIDSTSRFKRGDYLNCVWCDVDVNVSIVKTIFIHFVLRSANDTRST